MNRKERRKMLAMARKNKPVLVCEGTGEWDWSHDNRYATYDRLYAALQDLGWKGKDTDKHGLEGHMVLTFADKGGNIFGNTGRLVFEVPAQPVATSEMVYVTEIYKALKHCIMDARKQTGIKNLNLSFMSVTDDYKLVFTVTPW